MAAGDPEGPPKSPGEHERSQCLPLCSSPPSPVLATGPEGNGWGLGDISGLYGVFHPHVESAYEFVMRGACLELAHRKSQVKGSLKPKSAKPNCHFGSLRMSGRFTKLLFRLL